MSISKNVEKTLENLFGEKLPGRIDKIIFEAGFDTNCALLSINSSSIVEIEKYINENKNILVDTAYDSCLKNDTRFCFKPGHRALILSIPKKLEKNKEKKSLQKPEKINYQIETNVVNKHLDEHKLKDAIINKVVKFAQKCSFELTIDISAIFDFREESGKVKCSVQCPICLRKIKCEFKRYWIVSNLQKHLKNHFNVMNIDYVEVEENTPQPIAISYCSNQMNDLMDILED